MTSGFVTPGRTRRNTTLSLSYLLRWVVRTNALLPTVTAESCVSWVHRAYVASMRVNTVPKRSLFKTFVMVTVRRTLGNVRNILAICTRQVLAPLLKQLFTRFMKSFKAFVQVTTVNVVKTESWSFITMWESMLCLRPLALNKRPTLGVVRTPLERARQGLPGVRHGETKSKRTTNRTTLRRYYTSPETCPVERLIGFFTHSQPLDQKQHKKHWQVDRLLQKQTLLT